MISLEHIFLEPFYPANLTIIDNKLFDRHYSKTIFEQNNIRKIAFLVYLKNYNKYSFNSLLKLILELIQLRKHKSEEIIYPEAFLSFYDLLRINFSSIRQLKSFYVMQIMKASKITLLLTILTVLRYFLMNL